MILHKKEKNFITDILEIKPNNQSLSYDEIMKELNKALPDYDKVTISAIKEMKSELSRVYYELSKGIVEEISLKKQEKQLAFLESEKQRISKFIKEIKGFELKSSHYYNYFELLLKFAWQRACRNDYYVYKMECQLYAKPHKEIIKGVPCYDTHDRYKKEKYLETYKNIKDEEIPEIWQSSHDPHENGSRLENCKVDSQKLQCKINKICEYSTQFCSFFNFLFPLWFDCYSKLCDDENSVFSLFFNFGIEHSCSRIFFGNGRKSFLLRTLDMTREQVCIHNKQIRGINADLKMDYSAYAKLLESGKDYKNLNYSTLSKAESNKESKLKPDITNSFTWGEEY